jgi:hypothetical protein
MSAKKGKKGRRKRSYGKKKSAPKKDNSTPMGIAIGAVYSGKRVLMDTTDGGQSGGLTYLLTNPYGQALPALLLGTFDRVFVNAKDLDRYYGLGGGALVSASPKIPLIRMFAKPVDKAVRRLSKGKVSL